MSEIDRCFQGACEGDESAFGRWMGRVERPIRAALRPWARAVDVESVVQEALTRMWLLARDGERVLTGEDASLKFAIVLARNIARNEARRLGRVVYMPPGEVPETAVPPDPPRDHRLRGAIRECLGVLTGRPREAMLARVEQGPRESDRTLAETLGMTVNTFLQNVVRARKQMALCLEEKGFELGEMLP